MSDFYQTGVVATLHRLKPNDSERLDREMREFSKHNKIGLVLPALYSEFETPAMRQIADELADVHYLRHIVVALGRAGTGEYEAVKRFFRGFPHRVTILWVDSPPVQHLLSQLECRGLFAGQDGKGRSCWLACGYLLATADCDVIALHDCDIVNYSRQLLARLVYPVANPNLGFEFCKGYYARVTNKMHGRVTRLFMTPLIRAMESMAPATPFLRFLDSFRYPLAGEFAMRADLARANRIPCDWGLEIGVLAEIFRNCATSRICQVDLADSYEHKHQGLSSDDPSKGLRRMTRDIAKSLMRTLAGEGLTFTKDHFRSLEVHYVRMAEDTIGRYHADALLNGLEFDRHEEELAVAAFVKSLHEAASDFIEDPLGLPLLPNWNRVVAAIPEFFEFLLKGIEGESRMVNSHAA